MEHYLTDTDSLIVMGGNNIFFLHSFFFIRLSKFLLSRAVPALPVSPLFSIIYSSSKPSTPIPPPPPPSTTTTPPTSSISYYYFGFMSWTSSVSFMQPPPYLKQSRTKAHAPPSSLSVSSLSWAQGRSHQHSIRAQWQELCCSDRVQCAVWEAMEGRAQGGTDWPDTPSRQTILLFSLMLCGRIWWPCGLCQWHDVSHRANLDKWKAREGHGDTHIQYSISA